MIDGTTDWIQLVGSGCLIVFSLLLVRISAGHWYCKYGREALLCAALMSGVQTTVRTLAVLDVLTQTDARTINGFVPVAFIAILAQIIWMHRAFHALEDGH